MASPSKQGEPSNAAVPHAAVKDRVEDSPLTYNELVSSLIHFLEVAFHSILHLRHVYPPSIFALHRSYQIPVHRSRHPGLNEYISSILTAVREELDKDDDEQAGGVHKIIFVLSSASTGKTLERYIFELAHLLPRTLRRADRDLSIRGNVSFRQVQLYYRAFLMKLVVLDAALEEVHDEEDLTFAVTMVMKEGKTPGPGARDRDRPDEGMWVPADNAVDATRARAKGKQRQVDGEVHDDSQELRARRSAAEGQDNCEAIILPVKTLDSGVINLMLYVEDNPSTKAALRLAAASSQSNGDPPTQRRRQGRGDKQRRHRTRTKSGGGDPATQGGIDLGMDLDDTAGPRDIEEALLRDAAGLPASGRSRQRKGIAKRRKSGRGGRKQDGGDGGAAVASDEDRSDSSASSSSEEGGSAGGRSSRSPSEDDRSDVSIESVGDFAGYGGAGAGRGGGGMTAGW